MTYAFDLKPHPYSELFPMPPTEGPAWDEFKESLSGNRQRELIATFQGQILDGRCRYEACRQLGQEPRLFAFDDSPRGALDYVMARNFHRRNLTPEQRATSRLGYHDELKRLGEEAMKAARAKGGATAGRGRPKKKPAPPDSSEVNLPQSYSEGDSPPPPRAPQSRSEEVGRETP